MTENIENLSTEYIEQKKCQLVIYLFSYLLIYIFIHKNHVLILVKIMHSCLAIKKQMQDKPFAIAQSV